MSIFKECDIRGIFPAEIDEEKTYLIGRAFASLLPAGSRIVVEEMCGKALLSLKKPLSRDF